MSYHNFEDADGEAYGSFEVFYFNPKTEDPYNEAFHDSDGQPSGEGWYWWACFPGCMPDGDPSGPFKTEDEAITDAQA